MKIFLLLILATACYAQTIQNIVSNTSYLSTLSSVIAKSPRLPQLLSTADNFTFLAPNNKAFSKWLLKNHTQDFVDATLTYHLLVGSYTTTLFKNGSSFIATNLTDGSYSNVTGGQRVKVVNNGTVVFKTGNKTSSHLLEGDITVNGGFIHVIDTVLEIPSDFIQTMTNANLSYALAFFNQGSILDGFNQNLMTNIVYNPDVTYFFPNSASAVDALQGSSAQQEFMDQVGYYMLVGGVMYSASLQNNTNLTSYSGLPLTVRTLDNGNIYIDGAKVTSSDYLISNGVMHVLNDVLIPSNNTGSPVTNPCVVHQHQILSKPVKAGIGTGSGLGLMLLIILGAAIYMKQKRKVVENPPNPAGQEEIRHWKEPSIAPIAELRGQYGYELSGDKRWMATQLETQERPVELPVTHG